MSLQHLTKAIELVTIAVEEDHKMNYEKALLFYNHSKIYFLRALKYEASSENVKQSIRIKCSAYCERGEKIEEYLKKKSVNNIGNETKDEKKHDSLFEDLANRILQCHLQDVITIEKLQIKLSDVAGLDAVKKTLKELVVLPIKYPDLFEGKRIPWKAILLYGLSGTGKSHLVKAVATEAKNATFFSVSSSNLVSKSAKESRTLMRNLFQLARMHKPSIIFIDEADLLFSSQCNEKSESATVIKQEFFVQMQGTANDTDDIVVFSATNTPWILDAAVLKIFEKKIHIPLPEEPARLAMFELTLGNTRNELSEEDFRLIAKKTYRFSNVNITTVVKNVLMQPVKKVHTATHFKHVTGPSVANPRIMVDDLLMPCSPSDAHGIEMTCKSVPNDKLLEPPVTMQDVLLCLATSTPTVTTEDMKNLETFMKDLGEKI